MVGDEDFYIDLLFFNVIINCYVVIELKTGPFKPEYVGKLNFYVTAVDRILKMDSHSPTIGLLLCKSKNNTVVEYSLAGLSKPIGVSSYELGDSPLQKLNMALPSPEVIKTRIGLLDDKVNEKARPLTKPERKVIDLLSEDGTLTAERIADILKRKPRAVHDVIRALREKGKIVRVGGKKTGHWIVM